MLAHAVNTLQVGIKLSKRRYIRLNWVTDKTERIFSRIAGTLYRKMFEKSEIYSIAVHYLFRLFELGCTLKQSQQRKYYHLLKSIPRVVGEVQRGDDRKQGKID